MRHPGAGAATLGLLFLAAGALAKIDHYDNHAGDLYLEDDHEYGDAKLFHLDLDDAKDSDEFLEVTPRATSDVHLGGKALVRDQLRHFWDKEPDDDRVQHKDLPPFLRVKRQNDDTEDFEYSTDDPVGAPGLNNPYAEKDDEDVATGSGDGPQRKKEMTLQVSFVVQEPYQEDYSNRDSIPFQNLSHSLADSVNALYDHLPGIQRATLVRIQSRPSDKFSCKVSMDLVTQNYYDLEMLKRTLHDHIKKTRMLGNVVVSDQEFVFERNDVLEGECSEQEFRCSSGQCVPKTAQCNGVPDCYDTSDEYGCEDDPFDGQDYEQLPSTTTNYGVDMTESPVTVSVAVPEPVPVPITTTTLVPEPVCADNFLKCDRTRCIPQREVCDGIQQCQDGTDELNCIRRSIQGAKDDIQPVF